VPTAAQLLDSVLGPRTAAALRRSGLPVDALAKSAACAANQLGIQTDASAVENAPQLSERAERAVRGLVQLAKMRADRAVLRCLMEPPIEKAIPQPHAPPDPAGKPNRAEPKLPDAPDKQPPRVLPPKQPKKRR